MHFDDDSVRIVFEMQIGMNEFVCTLHWVIITIIIIIDLFKVLCDYFKSVLYQFIIV